jgi:succinylglutamate desuccinylase
MSSFINTYSHRFIGLQVHDTSGPTLVVFGGIHGNETAGVKAMETLFDYMNKNKIQIKGNLYAIKGNLKALAENERFIDRDLNRLWTSQIIEAVLNKEISEFSESNEVKELREILKHIFHRHTGPFYFLDIHTTSSYSVPFITISDSLNNRKFASKFKIPTVLGIEEYLEGPLLTYLNEYGHVSLGFEAGQHNEESSVVNSIDFIWKSLRICKCISKKEYKAFKRQQLRTQRLNQFYHITHKYTIHEGEHFTMKKGYTNFRPIQKGVRLAFSDGKPIESPQKGLIFMPLYQKQGNDGFFIIRKISMFWMALSIVLRRLKLHFMLRILPGIEKHDSYTLKVNPRIVVFFGKQIFHLLGYRKKIKRGDFWYYTRRDRKERALT